MSPSGKMAPGSAPEAPPASWPACATSPSPPSGQTAGPTSPPGSAGHPAITPTRCHYSISPRENAGPVQRSPQWTPWRSMAPGPSCRASIQTSVVSSMNGSGPPSSGDLGYHFQIAQANCSVSHRGVIRGIHFTAVPPGQAKYVVCASGAIIDVVVDLRVGSPTYARWEAVQLD